MLREDACACQQSDKEHPALSISCCVSRAPNQAHRGRRKWQIHPATLDSGWINTTTDLGLFSSNGYHVLKEAFQDTFDLHQESGTITLFGIWTTSQAQFRDLLPRRSWKSIKDIKTRHFGCWRKALMRSIKYRDKLRIALAVDPVSITTGKKAGRSYLHQLESNFRQFGHLSGG